MGGHVKAIRDERHRPKQDATYDLGDHHRAA
jgi:hypothetical protein